MIKRICSLFFLFCFLVVSGQAEAFTPLQLASVAGGGGAVPSFFAPLQTTLVPAEANGSNAPTFTRASAASFPDFEGNLKTAISGESRFLGARFVQNILNYSENNTLALCVFCSGPATFTATTVNLTAPNSSYAYFGKSSYPDAYRTFVGRAVFSSTANVSINVRMSGSLTSGPNVNVNLVANVPQIISIKMTMGASDNAVAFGLDNRSIAGASNTAAYTVTMTKIQIEDVTGQSNKNPSEYVPVGVASAPYYGAGVDGVQYFNYFNRNTVTNNIVSTTAPLVPINSNTAKFGYNFMADGDYFSTPSATANQITGNITLVVEAALNNWTAPASTNILVAKDSTTAGTRSYSMNIQTNGTIGFNYSLDGSTVITKYSTVAVTFANFTRHHVAVEHDTTSGNTRFYTSDDGITYTQLGTTVAGTAGAIYAGTSPVFFGNRTTLSLVLQGNIYDSEAYSGLFISGTGAVMAYDMDPSNWTTGSTWNSTETGETWTLNGNSRIYVDSWDKNGGFGYFSEPQEQNILLQSQALATTPWTTAPATATNNTTIAPDGTSTATSVVPATSTNYWNAHQSITLTTVGTISFYAKPSGYSSLSVANNTSQYVHFSLVGSGSISTLGTGWTSATIKLLPNGWYYCTATGSATTWGVVYIYINNAVIASGSSLPSNFAGDGTSGLYLWGAQLEATAFATSYIPTTTTAVTRAVDALSYANTGNIGNSVGTAYAESYLMSPISYQTIVSGAGSNVPLGEYATAGFATFISGSASSLVTTSPFVFAKVASYWNSTSNRIFVNGTAGNLVATPLAPTFTSLEVGGANAGFGTFDGTIRNVKIWGKALPAAKLQSLTTP